MEKHPPWSWITLLSLQIVQLLSLIPWLLMAGLSFMAFDAPGSDKMWQPWVFVALMWSYPLWLLGAGILSWVLFGFRRHVWAVVIGSIFTLLPVLGFLLVAVASLLG
jgi:hypothetical protein